MRLYYILQCANGACEDLSPHALYMRLKRLCQRSNTGKLKIAESIHSEWLQGDRDTLSLALVKALKTRGFENNAKTRKSAQARQMKHCFFHKLYCCSLIEVLTVSILRLR